MAELTPRFSTNRTVREYTERYYLPAAAAYRERTRRNGEFGAEIARWRSRLDTNWQSVKFGRVDIVSRDGEHGFEVDIHLGALAPEDVGVELYATGEAGAESVRHPMQRVVEWSGAEGWYRFRGTVPAARGADAFTARVVPNHAGVAVPLEAPQIRWQR